MISCARMQLNGFLKPEAFSTKDDTECVSENERTMAMKPTVVPSSQFAATCGL